MSKRERPEQITSFQQLGQMMGRTPDPPDRPLTGAGGPRGKPPGGSGEAPPNSLRTYLRDGYFVASESGESHLRVTLLTDTARNVAGAVSGGGRGAKTHQVRRFFTHVRLIENRLRNGAEFAGVVPMIAQLVPAAVNATKRGVAPVEFQEFIESNVREACKSEKDFRKGFVPHFEAVIAYLPREGGRG